MKKLPCPGCGGKTKVLSLGPGFARLVCVSLGCGAPPFEVEDNPLVHCDDDRPTLPDGGLASLEACGQLGGKKSHVYWASR